ncbi:putative repeat protein (TIGR02543 family) [Lysinibacillus sp. RC46]|uniref:InlB B-repeat-containing protein n=1 Tax=unclassified Lysinibacillus TaxID=2636778 RepID=UPI0035189385
MKKASLLLMIILLIFSQLSLGNLSVYATSNNETDIVQSRNLKDENILKDDENKSPPEDAFIIKDLGDGVAITKHYFGISKDYINIPDEIWGKPVIEIGNGAFSGKSLASVKIPSSVKTIGELAFSSNKLTNVDIPPNVRTIGQSAFFDNQLTSVKIPDGVKTIEAAAFLNNRLTNVEIPSSVTTIKDFAFTNNKLTSIEIPSGVTSIGFSAFNGNSITSVEIPESVIEIKSNAFYNNSLDFVTFTGTHNFQWSEKNSPFNPQKKEGRTFLGWFEDEDFTKVWSYSVSKPMTIYAKWSHYAVTFDSNGGSEVPSIMVAYNETMEAPSNPVKEGYAFEGWYKDKELTQLWDFDQDVVKKDITLYAKWEKTEYTVTFDSDGGSKVPSQSVEPGGLVKVPSTPLKEGYTFAGWYKDKGLTEVWDFDQDLVTKDITLYAKWSKVSYIVTFDSNGGSKVPSQSVVPGELVKAPSNPVKEGYTFTGWYKDKGLAEAWNIDQDVVEKDITLYAKWSKVSYIVTFDSNGGSEVSSQTVGYNELVKAPAAPKKEGYTFNGWHKDKELTVLWDFTKDVVTKNVTLYAKWTKDHTSGGGSGWTHLNTVTFDSNGGSEVPPQTVGFNDLVKAPFTPVKNGYQFTGWYKDVELQNAWDFTKDKVTADITLYAKWTKDNVSEGSYIVTFDSNGGSEIPSQTVAYKALVKAPSNPKKDGYTFIGWYKNKEFIKAWNFKKDVVTEDLTLYARWMKESKGCDIAFKDIDHNWAKDIIKEIANRCIIKGYPDGTFRPNDLAQRQHVVLMIDRALRPAPIREAVSFSDVPENHIYYEQITRLQRAGIVDGSNGAFRPDAYITRAQMAKIMVLAFGLTPEGKSTFKDVDPSHWASGYIATLADHNIALGDENGNFRPNENLTRAQFTAFMYRALGL